MSINPFVPKPWTPFQWEPMEAIAVAASGSSRGCAARSARMPGVEVETESPREAYLQTLLSRGDRRVGDDPRARCTRGPTTGGRRCARSAAAGDGVDPDRFVHRAYPIDALLPWDFIDHRVDKRYLLAERRKAFAELQTPPCDTATCHTCGAC